MDGRLDQELLRACAQRLGAADLVVATSWWPGMTSGFSERYQPIVDRFAPGRLGVVLQAPPSAAEAAVAVERWRAAVGDALVVIDTTVLSGRTRLDRRRIAARARAALCAYGMRTRAHIAVLQPTAFTSALRTRDPAATTYVLEEDFRRDLRRGSSLRSRQAHARKVLTQRRLARTSSPLVVISEDEAAIFARRLPGAHLVTIPHGIDLDRWQPQRATPGPRCDALFVGKLGQERNWRAVVDLLAAADDAGVLADQRWVIAGRSPAPPLLETADQLGVEVVADAPDLRPWYASARAVVVDSTMASGAKTTALQAWAMARPLVISERTAVGLPVRHGVNALVGASPGDLVDLVRRVLGDDALAAVLARNGRLAAAERPAGALAEWLEERCRVEPR